MPRRIDARSIQSRSSKVETGVAPEVFGFLNSAGVSKRLIEFRKKQKLFSQGEAAKQVFYIQEGSVKLSVTSTEGNYEVQKLKPFACLAFPFIDSRKIALKKCSFGDELVTSFSKGV